MIISAIIYLLFKISCILTKFDTTLLAHTLNIGFSWLLTNLFQSIPTLIVDRYFNNLYYYDFVKENFKLEDDPIGMITTAFTCLSVLMVYGLLTAIEKEDIKYLDDKYKS